MGLSVRRDILMEHPVSVQKTCLTDTQQGSVLPSREPLGVKMQPRSGMWSSKQRMVRSDFPKCLLIEQSFPRRCSERLPGEKNGRHVGSVLQWWHQICYEASRWELLIITKTFPHQITKTQWGGGLMWFMGLWPSNPSHFTWHEAIKAIFYSPVTSFIHD